MINKYNDDDDDDRSRRRGGEGEEEEEEKEKQEMNTISYEIFKENVKNISEISQKLFDNWHLKELINDGNNSDRVDYLEKTEQFYVESNLFTFVYQIFYSFSYNVPVFYLNAFESNGKLLKIEKIFDLLKLNIPTATTNDDDDYLDMFTITEHPYLHKPYYYIHPCKTSKWMNITALRSSLSSNLNYTLKWLSFIFSQLNLKLDLQYSKYVSI